MTSSFQERSSLVKATLYFSFPTYLSKYQVGMVSRYIWNGLHDIFATEYS